MVLGGKRSRWAHFGAGVIYVSASFPFAFIWLFDGMYNSELTFDMPAHTVNDREQDFGNARHDETMKPCSVSTIEPYTLYMCAYLGVPEGFNHAFCRVFPMRVGWSDGGREHWLHLHDGRAARRSQTSFKSPYNIKGCLKCLVEEEFLDSTN